MKGALAKVGHVSPAMIVAMIALFVALSGTAVATTSALITGNQIKNNSITGADIKNKSLRPVDFRGSVRGARGVRGLAGPPGPPGAAGAKGDRGDRGPSFGAAANFADKTQGCGEVELGSMAVHVNGPSLIFATAQTAVWTNNDLRGGTLSVELRNAANTTTLGRAAEDLFGTGANIIIPITLSQILTDSAGAPLVVQPGDYLLKLYGGGTNGLCASPVLLDRNAMSYIIVGAANT